MNIKKIIKANHQKSDIPQLQEEIKHVLGIQDKPKRVVFKKRFTLQLITTLVVILSVTVLGSSFFINPQAPNTPPIVDNEENNGNNNTISLLSQVIENMKSNSYTLTIAVYGEAMYAYKMDDTRIEINYFFSGTDDKLQYFIDLENEAFPDFYTNYDGVTWVQTVVDGSMLSDGYLFPMDWLDPTVIEDEWFEFDEEKSTYILKESFKETLYANSNLPLLDLQDVHVTMNASNDLIFTVKGQDDEIENYLNEFTITYSSIGSTDVNLPENIVETSDDAMDMVLDALVTFENNQYYAFKLNQKDGLTELGFFGTRQGDAILKTDLFSDTQTFVNQVNDTYYQVALNELGYTKTTITASVYNDFVDAYYPINLEGFSKDWFDLEAPTSSGDIGISYPIFEAYYDTLLNINLDGDVTILDAYVGFNQSYYQGMSLDLSMTLDINGIEYTLIYNVYGFNQVDYNFEPASIGDEVSLFEMLQLAIETKQYVLNQYIVEEQRRWTLQLYRDNMNYLFTESLSTSTYRYDTYGYVDDQYVVIRDLTNGDYQTEVIDQETYERELNEVSWIHLDLLPQSFLEQLDPSLSQFDITEDLFKTIASTKLQAEHTFVSGQFKVVYGFSSNPVFSVTLELINIETNLKVYLESEYMSFGHVTLEFPEENQQTSLSIDDLLNKMIVSESYSITQYIYEDGDFISELELFREGTNYAIYTYLETNEALLSYYSINEGIFLLNQIRSSEETFTTTIIDEATYQEAVLGSQWLQFESLTLDLFENVTKSDDVWIIDNAVWLQLISEEIKSNYTDFNGTIMIYEDDFGEFLRFSLEAIAINTNDLVIFEIDVYYIGQIVLDLPDVE